MLVYSAMCPLNTPAPPFVLPDMARPGHCVDFDDLCSDVATVVMFLCNHCPYVQLLTPHLVPFVRAHQKHGVVFVAISANDAAQYPDDAPQEMTRLAHKMAFTFPYCHDASQDVARAYGAACTPDFYLFDGARRLVYRGRYDAATPGNGLAPSGRDLGGALHALLAGLPISTEQKPSMGCNIKWRLSTDEGSV